MGFPTDFKALRKRLGLTQLQAAQRLGFNRTNTVSDWERGVSQVTAEEAAEYLRRLEHPPEAHADLYAQGFADAVSQMRAALGMLSPLAGGVSGGRALSPPQATVQETKLYETMIAMGAPTAQREAERLAPAQKRK